MRSLTAIMVAAFLLGGTISEAGLFSRDKRKLPKPSDWPARGMKIKESHKAGKRSGDHPKDYTFDLRVTLPTA